MKFDPCASWDPCVQRPSCKWEWGSLEDHQGELYLVRHHCDKERRMCPGAKEISLCCEELYEMDTKSVRASSDMLLPWHHCILLPVQSLIWLVYIEVHLYAHHCILLNTLATSFTCSTVLLWKSLSYMLVFLLVY